jgi:hypothetical protein
MKKNFLKLTVIIISVIITTSCSHSSSDDSAVTPTPTSNFLNYTYLGTNYSNIPSVIDGTKKEVRGSQGINLQYKKLSLWMPLNPTVGTHSLVLDPTNTNSYELHFVSQSEGLYLDVTSGSITITSVTATSIEGTFSGTGLDGNNNSIAITNGSFKCNRSE